MLTKYEFQKILRRKSTLIVMGVSLLLIGFLFALPTLQFRIYDQDGQINGLEGIAWEREQQQNLAATLTDEYIADIIRDYQRLFENPENVGFDGNEKFLIGDAYWNFESPHRFLLTMIARNYTTTTGYAGLDILLGLDMDTDAGFYQVRNQRIEELLNAEYREMTDRQQEYWRTKNQRLDTPLQFGYFGGWEVINSSYDLLMFVVLAICIVIAPVFAGEYQAGTDSVILAGKYGKTKLITAKIIASFLFGVCAFILHILVAYGIPLITFGPDGWNLPIQIANPRIPYAFTFLQATLVNVAVIFIVQLALIGFTLFLSSKMKTPFLVMIVLLPVLFIPMFMSPTGTSGLYNLILFLTPYHSALPRIGSYISYQFGGLVLDALTMKAVLYGLLTLVAIPFARIGFKKHQVIG